MKNRESESKYGKSMFVGVLRCISPFLLVALMMPAHAAERTYYRYTNEEGNTVLNHTLPPEFAQKGYEVVTASGHVVKVVEAVPDQSELNRQEAARRG